MADTKFKPGQGGRKPGSVNKTTKLVKEVFAEAFDKLQEHPTANLVSWAQEEPTEFYKLASKLIPVQLAGDKDNPIQFELRQLFAFKQDDRTE